MTLFSSSGASFLSRRRLLQMGAGLVGASAFGFPIPAFARRLRMAIVTGGTGGVFYPYGGGLAKVLTEKGDNIQATAQVTGGSVDNIMLLDAGEAEIGFSTVDSTFDAIRGLAPYDVVGPQKVNALAVLYESFLHVVVNANLPIQGIADLKGRRVSVGSAGSSTEAIADRALIAAGLDPRRDIVRDNLSVAESASALKDGKVAGFFWVGGVPTSAISDMASMGQPPLRILPAEAERRVMERQWPGIYEPFALPANVYVGQTEAVAGIGVANLLVVSSQVDGEFVTRVLKTIFDNLDTVHAIHPEARKLNIERAARKTAVPFHPAAEAFYRARGAGA